MIYFNIVGTVADVDETTPDNPRHPSPVLLLETDDRIERIVLPADAWSRLREVLKVGRRVRVAGTQDLLPKHDLHFDAAWLCLSHRRRRLGSSPRWRSGRSWRRRNTAGATN